MICNNCNFHIEKGAAVCPHCGKTVRKRTLAERVLSALRAMPVRNWMCVGVLLVAAVVAVSAFYLGMQPDPQILATDSVTVLENEEGTAFYYNGERLEGTYTKTPTKVSASAFGDVLAFMDDTTLYVVDRKGVRQVSEKVSHYQLSPDGTRLAYINAVGELYRYKRSSGKSTLIDYNVLGSNLCISSDGTMAYLKQEAEGDVMYYCVGKKPQKYADTDRYPVSVSDGAEHLYVLDGSRNLYHANGKKETKLGNTVGTTLYFTESGSDVLFTCSEGSFVFVGKGAVKQLAEAELTPVSTVYPANYTANSFLSDDGVQTRLGMRTFAQAFYTDSEGNLCYADKKYQVTAVADGVSSALVTDDGRLAFYLREGELVRCNAAGLKTTVLSGGIERFTASRDGRYIYYYTEEGTLYCKHGRLDPKELAQGVDAMRLSGEDYLFYRVSTGDSSQLYAVKGRGNGTLVCEDYTEFGAGAGAVYYGVDGERYFSDGDAKFEEQ